MWQPPYHGITFSWHQPKTLTAIEHHSFFHLDPAYLSQHGIWIFDTTFLHMVHGSENLGRLREVVIEMVNALDLSEPYSGFLAFMRPFDRFH